MKYIELLKTTNKLSGKSRYYLHDSTLKSCKLGRMLPISLNLFKHYENIAQRQECFYNKSCAKYNRQYKTMVV